MCFSLITRLIAFLFKVFLSRTMGAEALGLFSMGLAVFGLLTMIPSSGIPLTVSRKVAETPDEHRAHGIVTTGFLLTLAVNTLTAGLFVLFRHPLLGLLADQRAEKVVLIMLPATFSTCIYNVLRAHLMGRKRYIGYSVTETFEEIINVVVVLVLLYGGFVAIGGSEALAIAFLVGDILTLLLLIIIYIAMRGRLGHPVGMGGMVKSSTPITLMRLFTSLAATFTAIILPNRMVSGGMEVAAATAAYGEAVGMAYPLLFAPLAITSALSVVLLPELAQLSAAGDKLQIARKVDTGIQYILVISILFFILYATLGRQLGVLIYANQRAGEFVTFAAGMVLPLTLSQLTNTALNSLGLELKCFINTLLGLTVMALCLWFLPQVLGVYALAVAQTAFFTVCWIANTIVLARHHATQSAYVRKIVPLAVGAVAIAALGNSIMRWMVDVNMWLSTLTVGALCAVLYASLVLMTGAFDVHIILRIFKRKRA